MEHEAVSKNLVWIAFQSRNWAEFMRIISGMGDTLERKGREIRGKYSD
jgi:hypothetical protein